MRRIAIGGFQHETNTFSDKPADWKTFVEADGWPGMQRGEAMLSAFDGYNIGIAGLIDGAKHLEWEIVPLSWSYGGAGDKVTEDAYERICAMLLEDLRATGEIDGLLLDLHGAMVAEHVDDGEGDLLRRIRTVTGPSLPIVACLDLHANITEEMVLLADQLACYRTYPHLDMAGTGRRAASILSSILDVGTPAVKAFRQLPFLIPITAGCTISGPAKRVYDHVEVLEKGDGLRNVEFACGFNASDVPHCGPSLIVYGEDQLFVDETADRFLEDVMRLEPEFSVKFWSVEDAVKQAIQRSELPEGPVILVDVQDNYGGGAYSDTNWIFAKLVEEGAQNAAVGVLCDPEVAAAAHAAGKGAEINIGLGAKSGQEGHSPFEGKFMVEALSDGEIQSTGEYFAGGKISLGPTALLSLDGVSVVVSSKAEQAADQAMFSHLGLDPANLSILSLKSSVHYRADFEPIASEILEVVAPAPLIIDESQLDYQNLRPGLRIKPRSA